MRLRVAEVEYCGAPQTLDKSLAYSTGATNLPLLQSRGRRVLEVFVDSLTFSCYSDVDESVVDWLEQLVLSFVSRLLCLGLQDTQAPPGRPQQALFVS